MGKKPKWNDHSSPRGTINEDITRLNEPTLRPLPAGYSIRAAQEEDLGGVMRLLKPFVEQRRILRRKKAEMLALLHSGFVAIYIDEADGELIVGFCSVEIYSKKLCELQCLAVSEEHQHRGIGKVLASRCVQYARQHQVMEVLAISSSEEFFQDLGFDYALPNQKRAFFCQLRSREEVYRELEAEEGE